MTIQREHEAGDKEHRLTDILTEQGSDNMIFWKIDDRTIRCLINKEEIIDMGYDLGAISEDANQMEAFLEAIVQNSRDYIDWDTRNGIQNYYTRALPSDQFLITISCTFQDEIIDYNVNQIRKMTKALNSHVPEERLKRIESLSGTEKEQAFNELSRDLYAVCNGEDIEDNKIVENQEHLPDRKLVFESLDAVIAFAGMLEKDTMFKSTLFKSGEQYILLVKFDTCKQDKDAISFILTAEEYGGECYPVFYDYAYMMEHGKELIKDNALLVLASL